MITCLLIGIGIEVQKEWPRDPEAKKVISAMFSAYTKCKSYQDVGIADCNGDQIKFKTFFARPNKLYVEFESGGAKLHHYFLWMRGSSASKRSKSRKVTASTWDDDDRVVESGSLSTALAGVTGISYGGASTVPGFLFPEMAYGRIYRQMADFRLDKPETINGRRCNVISSYEWLLKIWIDQKSKLLVREETEIKGSFKYRIDFQPEINSKIPDSRFHFVPPVKALK